MWGIGKVHILITVGDIDVWLRILSRIFQHLINQLRVFNNLLHGENFVYRLGSLRVILHCDGIYAVRLAFGWDVEVENILLDVGCVEDF